ncbi:glycosyltransferase [Gluconobacter kanchanaburiensis]|nr:glycosyltransferase [Gluconobacter kanchanaburiensis]
MIVIDESPTPTARVECSPELRTRIGPAVHRILEARLSGCDVRLVAPADQISDASSACVLRVLDTAATPPSLQSPSQIPILHIGNSLPGKGLTLSPEVTVTDSGNSSFLTFLISGTPESFRVREQIRLLLDSHRDTRRLKDRVTSLTESSEIKTQTIQQLRVSLRMKSAADRSSQVTAVPSGQTDGSPHPKLELTASTPCSAEPESTPPSSLWHRIGRKLKHTLTPQRPTVSASAPVSNSETEAPENRHSLQTSRPKVQRVLFVAGEPDTPGVLYRCYRNAAAARDAGFDARVVPCASVGYDDIHEADVMILWRVEYSGHVSTILDLAKRENVITVFDADDIVFVPHYARVDMIDGIRSIGATEERIERCFSDMRRTFLRCDQGSATTAELVFAMHSLRPVVHLLPNIYDMESLRRARLALRMRGEPGRISPDDDLVRIGYATGSRTHQRDFAPICATIADVLRQRPQARLVLFREPENHRPVLIMDEFPSLTSVQDQIEWRDMVPLDRLQDEFARFDISIAPLETGNVFCEAKSEIKFFEAALSGVTTIASPTGPFRRIIRHGENGFLAQTPSEWFEALIELIDNPERRVRMARDAYHSILWPFGPQAQARRMKLALTSMCGDENAALAMELALGRNHLTKAGTFSRTPVIPESHTLFHHDALGEAPVTVVITSYNYEAHLLDALESVAAQTLPVLDLIVVDDGSSDGSIALARTWMERHCARFNRLILRQSVVNAGLGGARNIGMDAAETVHVMQLDADNLLHPDACEVLLASMSEGTAYAYPLIACFNEDGPLLTDLSADPHQQPGTPKLLGDLPFNPLSLVSGNRIDAMAMITKWAWAAAGGYYVSREAMGWEDFDLWCSLAELGLPGHHVPQVLADYRQHETSMTNASTEKEAHKARVVAFVQQRHPWIRLSAERAKPRTN